MAGLQKQVRSIPLGAVEHGEIVSFGLKVRYALPQALFFQMLLHCSCTISWKGLGYKEEKHLTPAVVESIFDCFKLEKHLMDQKTVF